MGDYRNFNDYEVMYLVKENDENAKDVLYEKYRPLIISMAYRYKRQALECGLEIEDLIQEGFVGLYNASQNYNPSTNALFYTYAMISIKGRILNCLKDKSSKKNTYLNEGISLFHPLPDFDSYTLMDAIEDKNAVLPHFLVEEKESEERIKDYLFSLEFPNSLIFELKLNGFGNTDISELLDIPVKKISNTLFRIRKDFQSYLLED